MKTKLGFPEPKDPRRDLGEGDTVLAEPAESQGELPVECEECVFDTTDDSPPTREAAVTSAATVPKLPYEEGDILRRIAKYDVLEELGRGGMGVVYRAFARDLGRYVAVKVIRSGSGASEIEQLRFVNEAMLAARLQHQHIVSIFDSGQTGEEMAYFVMEFIKGRDLGAYIDESKILMSTTRQEGTRSTSTTTGRSEAVFVDGKLTLRGAIVALEKAARAAHYAHGESVVHRDIKPDNILLDEDGEPHITDFGIAKGLGEEEPHLTTDGAVMGSPYYMSPEQASGEVLAIGPRTDVYSFGASMYHLLTGEPMFTGDSYAKILGQVIFDEPQSPSSVTEWALPLDLETICLKAVEKEQSRRYQTCEEFADDLRRWLDGDPIEARPVGAFERVRKRLYKNRSLLVGAFIAAALLLTIGSAFFVTLMQTMSASGDSLRTLDQEQAIAQADTLVTAVGINMLQGRADLARQLVRGLATQETIGDIGVYRADRVAAYSDDSTRQRVEDRLDDPEVLGFAERRFPDLFSEIQILTTVAFPRIKRSERWTAAPSKVPDEQWDEALSTKQIVTFLEGDEREGSLVLLKPVPNFDQCQVCHGEASDENAIRAVVVVRRPLDRVRELIDSSRRTTIIIGSATIVTLLVLARLIAHLFGIGFRRREFGG